MRSGRDGRRDARASPAVDQLISGMGSRAQAETDGGSLELHLTLDQRRLALKAGGLKPRILVDLRGIRRRSIFGASVAVLDSNQEWSG